MRITAQRCGTRTFLVKISSTTTTWPPKSMKRSRCLGRYAKNVCTATSGRSYKAKAVVDKQCKRHRTQSTRRRKPPHHLDHLLPQLHGIEHGGPSPLIRRGAKMHGGTKGGESCERGVTLRSVVWLGVTLADHTAEGDLVQLARNGALHLFFSRSL